MQPTPAGGSSASWRSPANPPPMPDQPGMSLASMGIYVFSTDVMYELLFQDAAKKEASSMTSVRTSSRRCSAASRFSPIRSATRTARRRAYWRDVGTLDAYYQTNMDLIQIDPILNLYDRDWPIHTYQPPMPPPKFVHTDPTAGARR